MNKIYCVILILMFGLAASTSAQVMIEGVCLNFEEDTSCHIDIESDQAYIYFEDGFKLDTVMILFNQDSLFRSTITTNPTNGVASFTKLDYTNQNSFFLLMINQSRPIFIPLYSDKKYIRIRISHGNILDVTYSRYHRWYD